MVALNFILSSPGRPQLNFKGEMGGGLDAMPRLGLGLYQMPKESVKACVDAALGAGYRLFDTATTYRNEAALGEALRELLPIHGLLRENVWITSKLAAIDHGYEEALEAAKRSVEAIGCGPLDLYLVHWPGKKGLELVSEMHKQYRKDTWRALEESMQAGLFRHIGVSNFEPKHLEEMKRYVQVMPLVSQVEIHPLFLNEAVVAACRSMSIQVQAYTSLAQGKIVSQEFISSHPSISQLLAKHSCNAGQLFLAWALHKGYAVIPKSNTPAHIVENIGCLKFELGDEDVKTIDALQDDPLAGKICWNPAQVA